MSLRKRFLMALLAAFLFSSVASPAWAQDAEEKKEETSKEEKSSDEEKSDEEKDEEESDEESDEEEDEKEEDTGNTVIIQRTENVQQQPFVAPPVPAGYFVCL